MTQRLKALTDPSEGLGSIFSTACQFAAIHNHSCRAKALFCSGPHRQAHTWCTDIQLKHPLTQNENKSQKKKKTNLKRQHPSGGLEKGDLWVTLP